MSVLDGFRQTEKVRFGKGSDCNCWKWSRHSDKHDELVMARYTTTTILTNAPLQRCKCDVCGTVFKMGLVDKTNAEGERVVEMVCGVEDNEEVA